MRLPGFTAETALARDARQARRSTPHRDAGGLLYPAVGGPGFVGMAGCIADCMDANPGFTSAQCRRACTAPAPPIGGGGGGGGFNRDACIAACEVVYGVCLVDSAFLGFPGCRAVRNACVSSCRRNI
jgi:hypothetical protein